MNFAYSNVTLSALRARQCDGHTTRNSFNVELNFCSVGICMELSVQSVHFRVSRHLSPPVWPNTSVLAKNLSIYTYNIYIVPCLPRAIHALSGLVG